MHSKEETGRDGGDRPARNQTTSIRDRIASGAAALIVRAVLWGLLPAAVAERLIRRTRGRDA